MLLQALQWQRNSALSLIHCELEFESWFAKTSARLLIDSNNFVQLLNGLQLHYCV